MAEYHNFRHDITVKRVRRSSDSTRVMVLDAISSTNPNIVISFALIDNEASPLGLELSPKIA